MAAAAGRWEDVGGQSWKHSVGTESRDAEVECRFGVQSRKTEWGHQRSQQATIKIGARGKPIGDPIGNRITNARGNRYMVFFLSVKSAWFTFLNFSSYSLLWFSY